LLQQKNICTKKDSMIIQKKRWHKTVREDKKMAQNAVDLIAFYTSLSIHGIINHTSKSSECAADN